MTLGHRGGATAAEGALAGVVASVVALSSVGSLVWFGDVHLGLLSNDGKVAWGFRYVVGGALFGLLIWRATAIEAAPLAAIGAGTSLYGLGLLAVPAALQSFDLAGPLALLFVVPLLLASFGLPVAVLSLPVTSGRRFVAGAVAAGWLLGGLPWLKVVSTAPRLPGAAYVFPGIESLAGYEGVVTYVLFYPSLAPVTLPVIAGCYGAVLCSSRVELADGWTGSLERDPRGGAADARRNSRG